MKLKIESKYETWRSRQQICLIAITTMGLSRQLQFRYFTRLLREHMSTNLFQENVLTIVFRLDKFQIYFKKGEYIKYKYKPMLTKNMYINVIYVYSHVNRLNHRYLLAWNTLLSWFSVCEKCTHVKINIQSSFRWSIIDVNSCYI